MNISNLNKPQQQAVKHISSPLLVLAGAGSGKTRVITNKIAYLIRECGLKASHIVAVTFTNKAAREMKSRTSELLSGKEGYGLKVSTFHHLGLQILRREYKNLQYKPGFSIYDAQDTMTLIKDITSAATLEKNDIKQLQWTISNWKNNFIRHEHAHSHAQDEKEQVAAVVYSEYQRHLKAYNALDFDDLIFQLVGLFENHPDILEKWQNRIRYLLVDEYQDTNLCQYALIKQLIQFRKALTVVGDDDQSVYAWRGARPENLNQLQKDFPELKVIKLEQNYRSTVRILKSANHLIGHNPHLFEKKLWSDLGYGDPIKVIECKNEANEAQKIVSEIIHRRFTHNTRYDHFAILYRGNHQSRIFETEMRKHRIPYFISGGNSFFERVEIKDMMSYLRLLANPDDDAAFLRIINVPRREIGPSTLEKLSLYAQQRKCSLLQASTEVGLQQVLKERNYQHVSTIAHWLQETHQTINQSAPHVVLNTLIDKIQYHDWLHETSQNPKAAQRRIDNVNSLTDWIEKLSEDESKGASISNLTAHLSLMDILERQNEDNDDEKVVLMTLHAAKGLEFPHVFLAGFEEEILPHRVSIEEESIEEERRLAYVGITRAQKTLTLTMARQRKRHGEVIETEPSRFLKELPQDDLHWIGKNQQQDKKEQQQRGISHLANIKNILNKST